MLSQAAIAITVTLLPYYIPHETDTIAVQLWVVATICDLNSRV